MRLFFGLILLVNVKRVLGEFVSAHLGDSVQLTASEKCRGGEEFRLIHRLKDDSPRTVATLVNGVWTPEEVYQGRIEHHSTSRVNLTRVNYNDKGVYEFFCGSRVGLPIELTAVIPFEISVTEGATIKLPCHSFTAGEPVKSVRWEKDGELVIERDLSSGEITYGKGFEGRVSVSSDWYSTGELSLTCWGVKPEDRGDYVCYIQDKDGKRRKANPATARVTVNETTPDQITPPPVSPTQIATEGQTGNWIIVFITAAATFAIVAPSAAGFGWWLKSRRSDGGRPSTDVEMGLFTERGPAGSRVNEGPSRMNANGY